MATLLELSERDSGVASSEATPESQILSPTAQKEAAKVMGEAVEAAAAARVSSAAQDDTSSIISRALRDDDDDDDNEDADESLMERLWGLTEMFPERLRKTSVKAVSSSFSIMKSTYELTRQVVWIAASTSVILFAPVMFELERLNVEEMMKQDRNRLVLGPGSAMSGPPVAPGLLPSPPTR
ncbi:mitochondrial import receptor subunit TOM22 homolog [Cherax quadricarinatus]|uniref:mitochondrial import receptor subunit TOM22 homolog n=1 Tax=Cherax quadricarinatus TaxID=27406 RepID=UPI0023786FB4|nr:mitochondrial import receptor subunit TOM22 homolog [Cherax quadricarinatus]